MVKYNELRIVDNSKLILDVSVYNIIDTTGKNLFENVYIKRIRICTHNQFVSSTTINETVFDSNFYTNPVTGSYDLKQKLEKKNTKDLCIELDAADLAGSNMSKNLFFVYIECYGAPDECIPCYMQGTYSIGIVFDKCPIVSNLMSYVKELNDSNECSIPTGLAANYLKYKMLSYSADTCNYMDMIDMYKQLVSDDNSNNNIVINSTGCGCK